MKAFTLLLIILALASCNHDDDNELTFTNDKFELTEASDWTLVNEQGIDTYVGYYRKGDYKINFDYGKLSFGDIDSIINTPDLLYYEKLTIDGSEAKIVREEKTSGTILSAYIDKGDGVNKNRLFTFNTSDDQLFMDIVKSHRFK